MKNITPVFWIFSGIFVLFAFIFVADMNGPAYEPIVESLENNKVTLYKSPTCGCCSGYADFLTRQGFDVEVIKTEDMQSIKDQYGIPREMESCHTSIFGDYFVEGHVPLEAVEDLLSQRPDIDGIALPDMPAGTPGMPGVKKAPYMIYQITDGQYSLFTQI